MVFETTVKDVQRLNVTALFLAVIVVIIAGCGSGGPAPTPAAPPVFPPVAVTATVVTTRDIPIYIDQIGKCASPEIER